MNERSKELAEQAGLYDEKSPDEVPEFTASFEKFAELIIQECVAQCEQVASHADLMAKSQFVTEEGRMLHEGMWGGATNCGAWIKKHFGIE